MKKIYKNILASSIATILCGGIISGVTFGIVATTNTTVNSTNDLINNNKIFNENTDIMFNNDYFLNVKDATDNLLSSRKVDVDQQLYIGDLNDAIIDNNTYNMVNTKKLAVYDTNKDIKKAYKTSLGTYTDDMLKAKKSMIADQNVLYLDHEFNQFRSENRAKDSIMSNTNTTPVSYYKVYDSINDKYVNINPLNKNDAIVLKEIALNNVLQDNTSAENRFKLSKYQVDHKSKTTDTNNLRYKKILFAEQNVEGKYEELLESILKNVISNALFNVRLIPKYKPHVTWYYLNAGANPSYRVDYGKNLNDANSGVIDKKIDQLKLNPINESIKGFTDRGTFVKKFNIENGEKLALGKVFNHNAYSKDSLFGYDNINIMYDGQIPWDIQGYAHDLSWNIMDFYSGACRDNVRFDLTINPYDFNANRIEYIKQNYKDTIKDKQNIFTDFLNSYKINNNLEDSIDWNTSIRDINTNLNAAVLDMITDKSWYKNIDDAIVIDKDRIGGLESKVLRDRIYESFCTENKKISNSILNNLSSTLNKYNLIEPIKYVLNQAFANDDLYNNKDTLYVVEYNDTPLYHLNLDDLNITNNETLAEEEIIRNKLINTSKIATNENKLSSYLETSFINVSNNVFVDTNKSKYLTKLNNDVNKTQKLIDFNSDVNSDFLINANKSIPGFNVSEKELLGRLNIRPEDDINLLKNRHGILQAIYYYNKSMKRYSHDTIPDELTKNMVKSVNDIPVLWQSNTGELESTYYGEYLSKKTDLNTSLFNSNKKRVYNSKVELNNAIDTMRQLQPIQLFVIKDHFNNIINFEYLDKNLNIANGKPISDGYGTNEETAYQNALNKIVMYADTNYVFYDNKLTVNEVNRLYTLDLKDLTNTTSIYTFIKYEYMYKYLYDYVKLNSVNVYN